MRAGASVGQSVRDRALPAEPAPGAQRVAGVERRIVALADRRRDAALREVAVRGERAARFESSSDLGASAAAQSAA